jgi:hypothetical protein
MRTLGRWLSRNVVALGLGLATLSGCQTYVMETGQTLPTGWYLQHLPQYIPPSPPFPLEREQAGLVDAINAATAPPAPAGLIPGGGPAPKVGP